MTEDPIVLREDALAFVVPGQPQAKQRPRVMIIKGRPVAITMDATKKFERLVRDCFLASFPSHRPWLRPVEVELRFFVADRIRRDLGNLEKSITDGLNGIAYADDSWIVRCSMRKDLDRENPRTEITLTVWPWDREHPLFPRSAKK